MVRLSVNGQPVEVPDGTFVLGAIEKLGIMVPTLCHHKALTPYGACRLCVVEVQAPGRPAAVQASCSYPALEGLAVTTDTARVKRARKITAELLLARCPDSGVIQRVAAEQGVTEVRISTKHEDCILCGLCVRMCEERMGRSAIGFTGRGPRKKLEPPFGAHNDACWSCGACDFICPVGKKVQTLASGAAPVPVPNAYNLGLSSRPAVSTLYPQAVPNKPYIDEHYCLHFQQDACGICSEVCGQNAIDYSRQDETVELNVGAVVLAPGYELYDPAGRPELGYGRYPNVITALQFERILSPSGPYAGRVLRPSDGARPRRIAFIQCVGSRDHEHDYCSSVCCMYATKEAVIAREHAGGELDCDIYFMDIRAFSKGFEAYFESARAQGIRYIRCRVPVIEEANGSQNLRIRYLAEDDRKVSAEYDLVVLSVGMKPPRSAETLAGTFGIELNQFHFCKTSPLDPVQTSRAGIFAAGPFIEPKDIPETVMDASAAASRVLALLKDARGTRITPRVYPPETDVAGLEPRVGVFVCHCGTNIAGVVDVPSVVAYARTLPGVVYAENNLYTCSNDSQERIQQKVREHGLNRVVVASCTPRTHEPLFRSTIREAGLNPYLFEMANIRDQCSWVHMHEPEKATVKARDLVRMAVAKVKLDQTLQTRPLPVTHDALVIGGGLAGMTAALGLADQGFGVHLVEREAELGGYLRGVRYLLNGEDPRTALRALVGRVQRHPGISVHLRCEVTAMTGSLGHFESTLADRDGGTAAAVQHGVVIVATGAGSYTPAEYLYGQDRRVMLHGQLEEQLGEGAFTASAVAFIQCVGSRSAERPYCSRTCCTETIKHALRLKEQHPAMKVYVLYRELRTYGLRESYYSRARTLGVTFIRFPDDRPPAVMGLNGKLSVVVHAATLNETVQLLVDNVVLAPATVPREENRSLAQMLKVPLNQERFFLEAHRKLRPVDFATDGMYLCGNAHSPMGIEETVAQALAAAARAAAVLSRKQIDLEPTISHVVEENCDGCAYCVDPCPFKAISLIDVQVGGETKKQAFVNEAACKGCGTCMATCPKNGIEVWHFRPAMLSAEVRAALGEEA